MGDIPKSFTNETIDEAITLLEFASKKGLVVDEKTVNVIVGARYLIDSNAWAAENEIEFWSALNAIVKLVAPVNMDSINARSTKKTDKKTLSDSAVNFYRWLTAVFLVFLLLIQIIWSFGNAIVTEINEIPKKIQDTNIELRTKTNLLGDKAADDPEISEIEVRVTSLKDKMKSDFVILDKLGFLIPDYFMNVKTSKIDSKGKSASASTEVSQQLILLQLVTFILNVFQTYLLPILYGTVGACTYILRSLINEIENVTYTQTSNTKYLLRFQLGAVAGLAIGWFASTTASAFASISQLALAFVAGYSVDLLFALMDKIISAFSSGTPSKN
jgi:hypothetical protein